jgi:SAM-dependent methyltransferase
VARRRYWLEVLAGELGGPRKLLDVGCGAGALLDVARQQGWLAVGQDIAEAGVREARARGHQACLGALGECSFDAAPFHAATMIEVIEHLVDPSETLRAARERLAPAGLLLVNTGDIGAPRPRLLGGRWSYIRPPGHVSYFTLDALTRLLERCGFGEVRAVPTYNVAHARPRLSRPLRRLTRSELCVTARRA